MNKSKYTATIDGKTFEILLLSESQMDVDGTLLSYDFVNLGNGASSLILDGLVYPIQTSFGNASVLNGFSRNGISADLIISINIRGRSLEVRVDDDRSLLLKSIAVSSGTATRSQVVRAPMPGLISRIEVDVGDEVAAGKGLLVLEAMKMENEIRSISKGTIQAIHVERGKAVEKGTPLVTIVEL